MPYTSVYVIHLPHGKGPERRSGRGRRDGAGGRGRARRGDDGRGRQALRVHDDVALPARVGQGRAGAADARRRARHRPAAGHDRLARGLDALVAGDARGPRPASLGDRRADHRDARHARAALVAGPRARGAGGDRAWTRASKAELVLLLNGYVFWAARLRFQVPSDATSRSSRPGSTSSRVPVAARARWRRASSRTSRGRRDEDFTFGLERVLDGIEALIAGGARRLRPVPSPRVVVVGSINVDLVVAVALAARGGRDRRRRALRAPRRRQVRQPGGRRRAAGRLGVVRRRRGRRRDGRRGGRRAGFRGHRRRRASRGCRAPTGVALIVVDAAGENQIAVASGANAALGRGRRSDLPGDGVVLLGHEVSAAVVVGAPRAAAAAAGWRVVLNPAPARTLPDVAARRADAQRLRGRAADRRATTPRPPRARWSSRRARRCWSRSARDGALLLEPGGAPQRLPATRVEVVDTTGAGDTVNGALAAELAAGRSLRRRRPRSRSPPPRCRPRRRAEARAAGMPRRATQRSTRALSSRAPLRARRAPASRRCGLAVWAGWIEPRRLVVREYELALPHWPARLAGLRAGRPVRPPRGRAARGAAGDPARGRRAQRARARRAPAARRLPRREPAPAARPRARAVAATSSRGCARRSGRSR